jgi:dynein heavy chain
LTGPYQAVGLWSKDGEYVPLCKPVQCVGQVEGWLNALADSMRVSLRLLLQDAVAILEEKTKDTWIWDFPAQVTLTASQIAWNAEVSAAFQRLEEGYENSMKDLHRKQVLASFFFRKDNFYSLLILVLEDCPIELARWTTGR